MTKKQMITACVEDQVKSGEVKAVSDLISRQEVKEILRTEWDKLFPVELDPYLLYLFHAMEKIENIPSAEPKD